MNSMYQQLMQLPLFQGVSTERITALVEKLPFHFLKYRNGDPIVTVGDVCTHIKFIVSGRVRVEMPFSNLRVSLLQTLSTPHVLAAVLVWACNHLSVHCCCRWCMRYTPVAQERLHQDD